MIYRGIKFKAKLFADDTFVFSVVCDSSSSSLSLNEDLSQILQWAYQWKMLLNSDVSKQAKFPTQKNTSSLSDIYFNSMPLKRKNTQKHLGLYLDAKLNFSEHINEKIKKTVEGINVIKKLFVTLPALPYQQFINRLLDQPNNKCLSDKIESVKYNASLITTSAIRRTSRKKLYRELDLESLKDRRWLRPLCYLHKVFSRKLLTYLYELMPTIINSHRNPGCYRDLYCRKGLFQNSFLSFSINQWSKLDPDTRNLDSHAMFC